jgi:rhodanese-related sulfurtransferase
MAVTTSVRRLSVEEADAHVSSGGAYVDLRRIDDYLDVHVPSSLGLEYEKGPGMPVRARDCIPLSVGLVLLDEGELDIPRVTSALRGKGFVVEGTVPGGLAAWAEDHGTPASTETVEKWEGDEGVLLDVGDPGASIRSEALHIPISRLWGRIDEVPREGPVALVAGHGPRAALAVGMLERAGFEDVVFWKTLGGPRRTFGKRGIRRVEP